jgi:hypothetical protein
MAAAANFLFLAHLEMEHELGVQIALKLTGGEKRHQFPEDLAE